MLNEVGYKNKQERRDKQDVGEKRECVDRAVIWHCKQLLTLDGPDEGQLQGYSHSSFGARPALLIGRGMVPVTTYW